MKNTHVILSIYIQRYINSFEGLTFALFNAIPNEIGNYLTSQTAEFEVSCW